MIYDILLGLCGMRFVEPNLNFNKPTYVDPTNSSFIDPVPSIVTPGGTPISLPMDFGELPGTIPIPSTPCG